MHHRIIRLFLALLAAGLLMLAIRAFAFTIYRVEGEGLEPEFVNGDRILVNRWSYGLRTGIRTDKGGHANGLFGYGRILRQPVRRGDIVAYENPSDSTRGSVFIGRVKGLPGDTIDGRRLPSVSHCDLADFYWMETLNERNALDSRQLGPVSERLIIGRVVMVVFSHDPDDPFWKGYYSDRLFLPQ